MATKSPIQPRGTGAGSEEHHAAAPEIAQGEQDLMKALEFLKKHGKIIGGVIVLIVGASITLGILSNHKKTVETQTTNMYNQAQDVNSLRAIVDDHPEATTAPLALIRIASEEFREGRYLEALSAYEQFLTDYANHAMKPQAQIGRLFCQEAQGQVEEALEGFTAFVEANPDHSLSPNAQLSRGRCLQQLGRADEAKAVYQQFVTDHPDSQWNEEFEQKLIFLERDLRSKS